MDIALFFGSFNPIHNGHIYIANHILNKNICQEIWFVVSPQNPLKKDVDLLEDKKRLCLAEKALAFNSKLKVCDIEFSLPKPSYTFNTLQILKDKYAEFNFHLIIGQDNLNIFNKWRDSDKILKEYSIIVYPRKGTKELSIESENIIQLKAELKDISSTEIREKIKKDKNIKNLVPDVILNEVINLYTDFL